MKDIKDIILRNLFLNEEFVKVAMPHIAADHFSEEHDKRIFKALNNYVVKYNVPPTIDEIAVELYDDKSINEKLSKDINSALDSFREDREAPNLEWLLENTEKYCFDKGVYNTVLKCVELLDGNGKNLGQIPEMFREALSYQFNSSIGHDYFEDFEHRFDYYNKQEYKIPMRLDYLKKVTKGGFSRKTLQIILGGVHAGKTAHMCSLAADNILDGQNVLFISAEMAAEEIAARIDANLLDTPVNDVKEMDINSFTKGINRLRNETTGKLIIREYPTSTAHVGHFRQLLQDLELKKNFVPDIIYIDYLNICQSQRISLGSNVNSYTYMKVISEELRGLAVEKNVAIVTATQLTRAGFNSTDPSMDDIAESFGVAATADMIYTIVAPDELILRSQVLFKQLKNRYTDMNQNPKFLVGFDRPKMRFYDVDDPHEGLIIDNDKKPLSLSPSRNQGDKSSESKFDGFKF